MHLLSALLLLIVSFSPAPAAEPPSVAVEGTEFKVTMGNGAVLRSADLVGAVLTVAIGGQAMRLRVDAVERDPDATKGDVWLHTLSAQSADGSWQNLCQPGPDGRRQGFPLAGRTRQPDGMFEPAEPGVFELTCTSGAQGKCVRFGYPPWQSEATRAHYNACIRMLRADYCGDGTPHTKDGTQIVIYDKLGIQKDEPLPEGEFEAASGPAGAICVRRVRVPDIFSLDALRKSCPRLSPEDIGEGCTEARMMQTPTALLLNKSAVK
jgi:hypothetical protein